MNEHSAPPLETPHQRTTAGVDAPATPRPAVTGQAWPPLRGHLGPGWWPCLVVVALTAVALRIYGVRTRDIGAFYVYMALAVTVPGTLLWRLMIRRPGHIGVDLAAGTAVGLTVEIPVYLLCRALDAPLAVLAWPLLTLA